jgi:hypothetical protein
MSYIIDAIFIMRELLLILFAVITSPLTIVAGLLLL